MSLWLTDAFSRPAHASFIKQPDFSYNFRSFPKEEILMELAIFVTFAVIMTLVAVRVR